MVGLTLQYRGPLLMIPHHRQKQLALNIFNQDLCRTEEALWLKYVTWFKRSGHWNRLCSSCLDNEFLAAGFPWGGPIMLAYLKILNNGKGEMGFLNSVELVDVVYTHI